MLRSAPPLFGQNDAISMTRSDGVFAKPCLGLSLAPSQGGAMRPDRMLARCALILSCLAGLATGALAQSATCRALQNELAASGRGGGARAIAYANAAQRQIDEMQRISAY